MNANVEYRTHVIPIVEYLMKAKEANSVRSTLTVEDMILNAQARFKDRYKWEIEEAAKIVFEFPYNLDDVLQFGLPLHDLPLVEQEAILKMNYPYLKQNDINFMLKLIAQGGWVPIYIEFPENVPPINYNSPPYMRQAAS